MGKEMVGGNSEIQEKHVTNFKAYTLHQYDAYLVCCHNISTLMYIKYLYKSIW